MIKGMLAVIFAAIVVAGIILGIIWLVMSGFILWIAGFLLGSFFIAIAVLFIIIFLFAVIAFVALFYYLAEKTPSIEPGEYKLEEQKGKHNT